MDYGRLVKENAYAAATQAAIFISGVLVTVLFPNILDKTEFGYFSIVLSLVGLFYILSDAGLQHAALYFLPKGMKEGCAKGYFLQLYKLRFAVSLFSSAALYLLSDVLSSTVYSAPLLASGIRVGAILLFLNSLLFFMDAVFVGLGRADLSFLSLFLYSVARVVLPLVLFVFINNYLGLLWGNVLAFLLGVILSHLMLNSLGAVREGSGKGIEQESLFNFIKWTFFLVLSYQLITWSDVLILGVVRSPEELATYRVAWLWASAVSMVFPLSAKVLLSAFSRESESLSRRLLLRSLKYSLVFSFMMVGGTILFAEPLLKLVYGMKYVSSAPILMVFSLFAIDQALYINSCSLVIGVGRVRRGAIFLFAGALLQALLVLLTAGIGLLEVAAAVVVVRLLTSVVITFAALRLMRTRLPFSYMAKPALITAALVSLFLIIGFHGFVQTLTSAIAFVAAYVILVFATRTLELDEVKGIARSML